MPMISVRCQWAGSAKLSGDFRGSLSRIVAPKILQPIPVRTWLFDTVEFPGSLWKWPTGLAVLQVLYRTSLDMGLL